MNAHIQADGQDNVIYTVHYRYTGSEESGGEIYSSTNIGTQSYTYVAGEPFTPYEDTEAFEAIVIGSKVFSTKTYRLCTKHPQYTFGAPNVPVVHQMDTTTKRHQAYHPSTT